MSRSSMREPGNKLYDQLRPLRTTGYKTHGWVWFYRQLPKPAVSLNKTE
jgi:hypothetical protein